MSNRKPLWDLSNAAAASVATFTLILVVVVAIARQGRYTTMTGVSVGAAYGLAVLIMAVAIRPSSELRRVVLLLLGTGSAWLLIWGGVSLILLRATHNDVLRYMISMFPLCALAAGTTFGLVASTAPNGFIQRVGIAVIVGFGSGLVSAIIMVAAMMVGVRGDDANFALACIVIFIPASAISGALWSAGIGRRLDARTR